MDEPQEKEARKPRIFISYSRKDSEFAERLRDELISRNFDAYLDKHDIAPGEPWQDRLSALLSSADTIVFCLSPAFVASSVCDWELNEAERLGKRLMPAVVTDTPDEDVPQRLKRLNYILMRRDSEFTGGLEQLTISLNTDIAWIRDYTRLTERTVEWIGSGRSESSLIRGGDIVNAETLLAERPQGVPETTEDARSFVSLSREAEMAREHRARFRARAISVASLTGMLILSWLGWFIYVQWQDALRRESLSLVDYAKRTLSDGDPTTAALLGIEAITDPASDNLGQVLRPFVPRAQAIIYEAQIPGRWREVYQLDAPGTLQGAVGHRFGGNVATYYSNGNAIIWNAETGKRRAVLKGHRGRIVSAVFSNSGRAIVTTSTDNTARIWDVETGKMLSLLKGHRSDVVSAAFSPDDSLVVTASIDRTARLWDAKTGREQRSLAGHERSLNTAVFSPDGSRVLTSSNDGTARIFDTAYGFPIASMKHRGRSYDYVLSAQYSPDGNKIVTASKDKTAKIWDANGSQLHVLKGHEGAVVTAQFSFDGTRIVTAAQDRTARIWDAVSGQSIGSLSGHKEFLTSAQFSRGSMSQVLTSSYDGTARVWDGEGSFFGEIEATLSGHSGKRLDAYFLESNTRILTAGADGNVRLWEWNKSPNWTGARPVSISKQNTQQLVYSSSGAHLVLVGKDNIARIISRSGASETIELAGHRNKITEASFSADDRFVVTASEDKTARVWRRSDGKLVRVLKGHNEAVTTAQFSPNGGTIATGSSDNIIRLWSVETGKLIATGTEHENKVVSVRFSPDGHFIMSASEDGTVRTWQRQSLEPIATLVKGHGPLQRATYSTDGLKVLYYSYENTAHVLSVESEKRIISLAAVNNNSFRSASFSPDGKRIVTTAKYERAARTWDVSTGELASIHQDANSLNNTEIYDATFSPNSNEIAVSGPAGVVVWQTPERNYPLIARTKQSSTRCLSPQQRKKFHLSPHVPNWCYRLKKWPYQDNTASQGWFSRFNRAVNDLIKLATLR